MWFDIRRRIYQDGMQHKCPCGWGGASYEAISKMVLNTSTCTIFSYRCPKCGNYVDTPLSGKLLQLRDPDGNIYSVSFTWDYRFGKCPTSGPEPMLMMTEKEYESSIEQRKNAIRQMKCRRGE